jgi:hypothetical protein
VRKKRYGICSAVPRFDPISKKKKNLLVRIKECLYSRTVINVWAPAERDDQEKTEKFYANLFNLMTLFHSMTE